jgi:hypothetical protein
VTTVAQSTDHPVIVRYNRVPDEDGWWEATARCSDNVGWSAAPDLALTIGEAVLDSLGLLDRRPREWNAQKVCPLCLKPIALDAETCGDPCCKQAHDATKRRKGATR